MRAIAVLAIAASCLLTVGCVDQTKNQPVPPYPTSTPGGAGTTDQPGAKPVSTPGAISTPSGQDMQVIPAKPAGKTP